MIIKCETLEQVKKIVEIEGWDDWNDGHFRRVADILEIESVCVDTDETGHFDELSFHLNDNPELEITNFENSKYAEAEGDKMENKIKVRIVKTDGNNWYKVGEEYEISIDEECGLKYYRFSESRTIAKKHCEIVENEDKQTPTTTQIEDAIALLKVSGYTITPPRITEEQAIEKIKEENEKIGYMPNWEDEDEFKYSIYFNSKKKSYSFDFFSNYRYLSVTYTTEEIAEKICKELNGKAVINGLN